MIRIACAPTRKTSSTERTHEATKTPSRKEALSEGKILRWLTASLEEHDRTDTDGVGSERRVARKRC
ncbi:hypothetical protein Ddye_010711 [Dipteronia dyeriana]|uniref:Uncharacterized protein n=1 Tax=Dipteronia dyeriana TaxID=168575 RepID=A0AAD9XDV9_9ROSI|nr:hypothetical protein Ddye_010711 [Dipteronia dyeriana]